MVYYYQCGPASCTRPPSGASASRRRTSPSPSDYQCHLRRLQDIRTQRRQQLGNTQQLTSRNLQITQIKEGKSRTFAHRFNRNNYQINQSNLQLLTKL